MGYELPYYSKNIESILDWSFYYETLQMEIVYTNYFEFKKNNFAECAKCESFETKFKKYVETEYCLTYLYAMKISNIDIIFI